ncbi:hypothetical protein, membrane [gut metagenome]|uniref:ATP synthase protein I n=1 Tax=gut metagenome TaxID=749906 RepID=J9GGY4_9ZZZZ
MNISRTKRNFIGLHTLFAIVSSVAGVIVLETALPGLYFGGYPFVPLYFYLFGVFSIYLFDICRRHAPQKMLLMYLAVKVIKMLLSMILVVAFTLAFRQDAKVFLLTFVSFYLLYLVFETWFFFTFELSRKLKKKNKKENEKIA